jgi:hypothetical protein
MSSLKHAVRMVIVLIGAVLYLTAIAYLYSRPEVRVFGKSTASLFTPASATASETGCSQQPTDLSEEAVRKRVQQNRHQIQKSHSKEEKP